VPASHVCVTVSEPRTRPARGHHSLVK